MMKHESLSTTRSPKGEQIFSKTVNAFWQKRFLGETLLHNDASFSIAINSKLDEDNRVMLLKRQGCQTLAVLTPALAEKAKLETEKQLSEAGFRQALAEAGTLLHGADAIFYYSDAARRVLPREPSNRRLRQLTGDDAAAFLEFQAATPEEDLDAAYVELDHWAVFGAFEDGRLVYVASMYPWESSRLADIGIVTLPGFRGRGHARNVLHAISWHAYTQGYEPQYRCQLDNRPSQALAAVAGLIEFGRWEVVSPDSPI